MEIANRAVLDKAGRKNARLRTSLDRWAEIVAEAEWQSIDELRETFPSADGVMLRSGTIATVFNIGGGAYRLIAIVFYLTQRVYVAFVLTHAEYDKEQWKGRL